MGSEKDLRPWGEGSLRRCGVVSYCVTWHGIVWYGMLCCAMLCYAMLCYAMLCYAMLCYAMLCYAMLCYAMLCYAMLCYAMLCYAMLWPGCSMVYVMHGRHAMVWYVISLLGISVGKCLFEDKLSCFCRYCAIFKSVR